MTIYIDPDSFRMVLVCDVVPCASQREGNPVGLDFLDGAAVLERAMLLAEYDGATDLHGAGFPQPEGRWTLSGKAQAVCPAHSN